MQNFTQWLEEQKRWGRAAAGVMIYCTETGNVLWNERSRFVMEPNTWSLVIGGKIDEGESAYEAARREFVEETGYTGPATIRNIPLCIYRESGFMYSTFLARVPMEFKLPSFSGTRDEGQWEIEDYMWTSISKRMPKIHFGTKHLLKNIDKKAYEPR